MKQQRIRRNDRRGAMLVLIAVCLPLFVAMAAFAVDVAWMQLVRAELRLATDAAARAGAKELSLAQNIGAARARAKEVALRNHVAGEPLLLTDDEIEIGRADQAGSSARFQFTPGGSPPNAMRVTGRRTQGSAAGAVDLLFAGVLGVHEFEPVHVATSSQLDRDICLVIDRSGSMMWTLTGGDFSYPPGTNRCTPPHPTLSRWGALSSAVNVFLDEMERLHGGDRIALTSYSSNATDCGHTYNIADRDVELTRDYVAIRDAIQSRSDRPVVGFTAISAGLDLAIDELTGGASRPFAAKTVILMTDGLHNLGPDPVSSAQRAARQNIVVHTITFSRDADVRRMRRVANATGGRHFHANTTAELIEVYREIAHTLPVLLTE